MALEFDSDSPLMERARSLNERESVLKQEIRANGGKSEFPALFDLNGNRVRAKLVTAKYGTCWMFFDEKDEPTGKFVKAHPVRESTLAKKGFREGKELAPAAVKISGGGNGLAAVFSCHVIIVRTDDGYPADAMAV